MFSGLVGISSYQIAMVTRVVTIILSVFGGLIGVGVYIVKSLGVVKALKIMQYKRPWMGWIPFADYWAMADCVIKSEDDAKVFGVKWPILAFKYWYVPAVLYAALVTIPVVGEILMMAIAFYFFGTVIMKFYAKIEGKEEKDVRVLAYISGAVQVIAFVKFLTYNANTCFDENGRPYVKEIPQPQPVPQQAPMQQPMNGAPQQAPMQQPMNGIPQQAPQQPMNGVPQQAPQQPMNGMPQQAPQQQPMNGVPQQEPQQPMNGMPQQAPQQPMNEMPQQAPTQPMNGMPQQAPQQPMNGMPQQAPMQQPMNGMPQQAPMQQPMNGMPQHAPQQPPMNGMQQ